MRARGSSGANDNRPHATPPPLARRKPCAAVGLSRDIAELKRQASRAGYGTLEHLLDLALIEARELEREETSA